MSIRIKLALLLTAGMAAATLSSGWVFLGLEHKARRKVEADQIHIVMANTSRMAMESLLAKDPLMLLDYLAFLNKDRVDILGCRVFMNGRWDNVGRPPDAKQLAGARVEKVEVPSPDADPKRRIALEVYFSQAVLQRQDQKASQEILDNLSRSGSVVLLAGLILALPLSMTLTRRIVKIEKALDLIGQGKLGERVAASGSDEIGRLARGVNQMSGRLKEVEEMKKTFIASVTHELRSPLGAIQSHLKELLGADHFQPAQQQGLERIQRNVSRLEHFVTNLLEMSKIERGKLDYYPRPSDLPALIEDTVLFFSPRAKEANLQLDFEVEPSLPRLSLDPDLISQVLANFISNAIKFTRAGGRIHVAARKVDSALECSVTDSGIGLAQEALSRIFRPFERVKNPLKATGVGLGLAISKSIIELHHGSIGASSEPGKGSRFFFTLPLVPVT